MPTTPSACCAEVHGIGKTAGYLICAPENVGEKGWLMNRIVFGCAAVCAACAAGAKVELTLEFAPGADVASDLASVRFAPLKDNRAFAFTTRWDDTHKSGPAVAQVLREYGIPGTFYHVSVSQGLIDGILGPRQEIGSHTSTHCSVGMSSGNTSFLEMMGNRCDLECAAQRPVLSFVLPGCVYWDPFWTGSGQKLLGEAIRRVGFTSSPEFAGDKLREKYGFSTNEFVVSHLFCPDDRKNWPEKFEAGVSNALEQIAKGRLREPIITQGVHPWLDAQGFANLHTNMASIARNTNAWFCTQTEYAAYRRQLASARILSARPTSSTRAVVTLDLPPRGAAGADVPLTLLLPPSVRAVNGAAVTTGLVSVSLPGPSHVPAAIDQVVNADNAPGEPIAAKRLPLAARLSIDVTQNVARLVVRNASAGRLRLAPRLRLPPRWRTGVVALDECELAPGGTRTWTCGLGVLDTRAELVGGRILAVAEVEVFDADARCSRLWVRTAFELPKAYPDRGELPIYFTGTGTNAVHLVKVDKPGDYRLWAYCGKQGFTSVRVNGASVKLTPYCPSAPVRLQAGENRIELCYRPGKNGKTWYAFALTHPKGDPRFEFLELSDVGQG